MDWNVEILKYGSKLQKLKQSKVEENFKMDR